MKPSNVLPLGAVPSSPAPAPAKRPAALPASGGLTQALVVAAVVLVVGVTALQGAWTGRWSAQSDPESLRRAARALEASFPEKFGDWEWVREIEVKSDPKELDRAGAVGHVARSYRNSRTKTVVSTFTVCATPYHASAHTPDRCYPGAGFEIAESEHRLTVPLTDGRDAETFTGTFRKENQTLRVFWTYGLKNRWIAPQLARIELQNTGVDAVYKLYAIIDETKIKNAQALDEGKDFVAALLPALDAAVAAELARPAEDAAATAATPMAEAPEAVAAR